jgi:hypothetical protein
MRRSGISLVAFLVGFAIAATCMATDEPKEAGSGAKPYGVSPPSGQQWTMTFEDDFTQDRAIDTKKWNGGASNTDWGARAGNYMFIEPKDNQDQNYYGGLTLSRTNGLEFRSPPWWKGDDGYHYGGPSAAIQTGGTTPQNAKFIQKYGYWEARVKQPHNNHGEGNGLHPDFWMHPIPEDIGKYKWLPEINVGEQCNYWGPSTAIGFGVHDCGSSHMFNAGTTPPTDLSADWHTYGLYWRDDETGPYGSMQCYLDGKPLEKPYTLSSEATNMANGIYVFLSLDNDNKGADWQNNPWMVQYVRVWQLGPSSSSSSSGSEGR